MTHFTIDQAMKVAVAHHLAGRFADAESLYRQVLAVQPNHPEALYLLGVLAGQGGRHADAIGLIQQAIDGNPSNPVYHRDLGVMLQSQGRLDETIACYQQALALKNDLADVHYNLGLTWTLKNEPDKAIASFQRAIEVNPDFAEAHNNLGAQWERAGDLDKTLACYRRALELKPDFVMAHNNLLYALPFHSDSDPESLFLEFRRWNRQHAQPLSRFIRPHTKNRDPDRRLRIGYVSPDFRDHCQALFTIPLFSRHNHAEYEVFCFSSVSRSDDCTRRIAGYADVWREVSTLDDPALCDLIRNDRIDVLVDLTMHMNNSRLLVFARKPAPVQVAWLAYPGTTGMDAIDYRLTDPHLDPPGCDESFYSERSIRLPDTFWCYDPLSDEPQVNALPCAKNGFVTFGCLNNFAKVNDSVLNLWVRVLHAVADSRLILLAPQGNARRSVLDRLVRDGIDAQRIEFVGRQPRPAYLQSYHRIDIALDTFPSNGHTTSLDSLWMGVPVITLVGNTLVGRAGLSQLTNLHLTELIARSPEHYVQIAADLSADRPRLAELRATLRQRMENSPLMDAGRFARNIEAVYRTMWRRWCQS